MLKRILSQTMVAAGVWMIPALSWAQQGGEGAPGRGLIALGAGIGVGIASFGGALGQGKVAGSALEGISRNPAASGQMFVPFILGIAFVESLVLLSFVVTFLLQGKV